MKTQKMIATVMATTMVAGSVGIVSAQTTDVEVIKGENRTETAVKISKEGWKTAETVVVVNDAAIADALTATPLAFAKNAPILLTSKNKLSFDTKKEIKRLGAKNVILIGGNAVLPKAIENELEKLGLKIDRVEGKTREETALEIAKRLDKIKDVSEIAVVNGTKGLADAVSVAAAAAERNMPILLANPTKGLAMSEKFIKDEDINKSFVIGGKVVLSDEIVSKLPGIYRIEGSNRNDTNAKVIEEFYKGKELKNIYLAKDGRGGDSQLIDALAVGVLAAKNQSPVLIASGKLNSKQVDVVNTKEVNKITQVGGNGNEGAFEQLENIEKETVYEVETVEEFKEALEKADANDKIVLKPNTTITEDIIVSTDKNVDIVIDGKVNGKVDVTAPNGSVSNNSTSTGGGSITPSIPSKPSKDQAKVDLIKAADAASKYVYSGNENEKPYKYTGKVTMLGVGNESGSVNFEGEYKSIDLGMNEEKKAAMNDMARYLGALYRANNGEKIKSIEYNGNTYNWSKKLTLKGSNWVLDVNSDKTENNTLVSNIVKDAKENNKGERNIKLTLVDKNGKKADLTIGFKSTLPAKVDNIYYTSLAEAVLKVANSKSKVGTVILTKDTSGGGIGLFNNKGHKNMDLTIDLGGYTYTMTSPAVGSPNTESQAFHLEKDNKVNIKNGNIVVDSSKNETKMLFQNYCDLTLENLNLVGGDSVNIIVSCNNGNTVLNNVNMDGTSKQLVGIDVMHWHGNYPVAPTLTINNNENNIINGKIDVYCYGEGKDDCPVESKSKLILNGGRYTGNIVKHEKDMGVIKINAGIFSEDVKDYCGDKTCTQLGNEWIVK